MTKTAPVPRFNDNPAIKGKEARYDVVFVDCSKVIKSWKASLFSFEWLAEDGSVRALDDLPLKEHDKRAAVEKALSHHEPLDRPVLGIGIMDNVEIGAGRDVFLTLASLGAKNVEVHIPKSCTKDFKDFIDS